MNNSIPDNWYEHFFSGINCEIWEKAVTQEWTESEVAFIMDVLKLPPESSILDMPCGNGRHSVSLASKGFRLTSVDLSKDFLNSMRATVASEKLDIHIVEDNILTVQLGQLFDGAFCLGNSFGYFDYTGMQTFVGKVSGSLRKGGKWIVNTGLAAESFLSKFITEKSYNIQGIRMDIHNDYDEWNSCLLTTLSYTKNGIQESHRFKHHVYTVAELIRLLNQFDLHTIALYSSTQKDVYQLGADQLFLVAEKQ